MNKREGREVTHKNWRVTNESYKRVWNVIESPARTPGRQMQGFRTLLALRKMSPVLYKQKFTFTVSGHLTLKRGQTDRQVKGPGFLFWDDKELRGIEWHLLSSCEGRVDCVTFEVLLHYCRIFKTKQESVFCTNSAITRCKQEALWGFGSYPNRLMLCCSKHLSCLRSI